MTQPIKIALFYFFFFSMVGAYLIFIPKVLHDLSYSTFEIGVIFATIPLIRFIMPFLFLKQLALTRKLLIISAILLSISSLFFYFTIENFYLFLINNIFCGVAITVILPYIETIAINVLQKERYGKIRLFGSIGFMLVALILAELLTSFYVAIHFYAISAIITAYFAYKLSIYDKEDNNEDINNISFSLSKEWQFWVSIFLLQVAFGGFYNFFTIYETEHGLTLQTTSYLWSFGVLCEIIMLYFQAPLLKFNLLNIIKFTIFLTIIRWFVLYFFAGSLMASFISQSLHAFGFALYHTATIAYLYNLYSQKKIAQQFFYGLSYGLGGFIGAIFAGYVYGEYIYLIMGIITALALAILYIKPKKEFYEKVTN